MLGIRCVGVDKCQSVDFLARNPHKGLAREISHETGRGRGKEGSRVNRSGQNRPVDRSRGKQTVKRRRQKREVERAEQSAGESR